MSARDYWHMGRSARGRTCWSGPFSLWSRLCLSCAWRTITGKNRAARKRWEAHYKTIRDCGHKNTRHNPEATAVLDRNPRVCLDCGIGIVDGFKR